MGHIVESLRQLIIVEIDVIFSDGKEVADGSQGVVTHNLPLGCSSDVVDVNDGSVQRPSRNMIASQVQRSRVVCRVDVSVEDWNLIPQGFSSHEHNRREITSCAANVSRDCRI